MFNISKQGSSLLITSNDNSQFPWKDGQMSLPMNSVVYVIDESDYIAFRSASNNDILFTALIDEIQINGTNVTKDDFILQFDNVANSAGGGGGSASAGVNSINGFQGDLTLKSINGQSLIGSGDITIEGGGSITETDPIFESWKNRNYVTLGNGAFSDEMGIAIGSTAESTGQSVAIGRNAKNTDYDQVAIGYGIKNDDEFYTNINDVIKGDSSKNAYIKNANGTYTKILDLINNASGSSEPEQYIVSIENFWMYTKEEPYKKLWLQYIDSSNKNEIITKEIILEWTGTQSEYDALGEYDDSITYNIIEG